MRLLKLFESRTTAKPVELVEKDMLRLGMSSYDVDMDAEDDRVHLRLLQQGMDIAEVIYEDGEVIWIHVEPFFRHQGLGSAMVKYLQDHGYPVVMPDARTDDGKIFFGKLAGRGKLDESTQEAVIKGSSDDLTITVHDVTMYGAGVPKKYFRIDEFSSHNGGMKNTPKALMWLKQHYGFVQVNGIGLEPNDSSWTYWAHMKRKGLVDELLDEDGNSIIVEGALDEIQDIGDFADEEGMARDTRDIDLSRYEFWAHLHAGVDLHMSPNGGEFAFVKNGKPVGHVSATYSVDDHIGRCFRIGMIWLSPDLRRQGIGLAFYRYLLDTRRIAVMSDDHQSDIAQIIWDRLVHTYEAAVYQYGELPRPIKTGQDYLDAYDDSDDGEYKQLVVFPQKRTAPLLAEDEGEFDWTKPTTFYRGVVDPAHAEKPFTGTRLGVPTFTDNWHIANVYAKSPNNRQADAGKSDQVYAYRLNIKNPIHLNEGREDVTEANNILRKLGITDVDQAWKAFQSLYKSMVKADQNSWRSDSGTFYAETTFPVDIDGFDNGKGFSFPDRTYTSLKEVFYEHWTHDWPGLYCHSFNLANSTTFQKMAKQAGFDGIVMYGHNQGPSYADDEDVMTGTSYDGITVMEWRALDPSQIEFLGPAPTGAIHESSDPTLDQLYAAIYRDKAFARETSTPIEEFIETIENEYPEICWWEPGHDVDDVMASTDFWAGFKTWLGKRYAYVMNNLNTEMTSYPATVVRAMTVTKGWDPKRHGVGLYWAVPGSEIHAFGGRDGPGYQDIMMTAVIQKSDINWFDTIRSRLDFMNGDEEGEIQLFPEAMVKVISIENDGPSFGNNGEREELSLAPGIYPAATGATSFTEADGSARGGLRSVPTYTPAQIATKHKVTISAIMRQLAKGIKVEHEHTTSDSEAREIALDHLWEMPDYYDRLSDMEKQAGLVEGPPVPLRVTPTMISRARDNKCQVIVEMTIDEFLRMTTSDEETRRSIQNRAHSIIDYNRWAKMGHNRDYYKAVNDRLRADWNPEDGEFQNEYGNDLMPFLTIQLNATGSTGKIVGHEGRHRGSAAARAGAKTMMVALRIRPGEDMFPGIYSPDYFVTAEHIPARITGQFTAERFSTSGWKIIDGDMQKRTRDRIIRD